ncbi:hypothetical protein D910_09185 [Dendroctonus ponderosae]
MYTISLRSIKKLKIILFLITCFLVLLFFGAFHHAFEKDFFSNFHYPYDGDIEPLVIQLKNNQTPNIPTINNYNFYYYKNCDTKCRGVTDLRLVYLIKSSVANFDRRVAIRSSWGFQKRFSDVEIRTLFLIGLQSDDNMQASLNEESQKYKDIIQANYTDSYFNNTYKTMSGFEWVMKYCKNAKFYMFVDDDYYVSTKNVLRFLRFPTNYPNYLKEPLGNIHNLIQHRQLLQGVDFSLDDDVRLYTGYAFQSSPHRHYISKWYVSLDEYPYHMWPAYVSGGAYILSNAALVDIFDDIYVGILAYKAKIEPFHSEEFHFYKRSYSRKGYDYVVASHGYSNTQELVAVWNEQKSIGNA